MKHLKAFNKFAESLQFDSSKITNLMESLNVWHDIILASIGAEQVDILEELKLGDMFKGKTDIDYLSDSTEFINSLGSIGLKKAATENTDDYQTFVNKPCKFMLIYQHNANELEDPKYILFQVWNEGLKDWDDSKLYKINGNMDQFYDKLSSKTIEILDGEDNYIYNTSNGSDWELQNAEKSSDIYKKTFRKEDFQQLLNNREVKLNII